MQFSSFFVLSHLLFHRSPFIAHIAQFIRIIIGFLIPFVSFTTALQTIDTLPFFNKHNRRLPSFSTRTLYCSQVFVLSLSFKCIQTGCNAHYHVPTTVSFIFFSLHVHNKSTLGSKTRLSEMSIFVYFSYFSYVKSYYMCKILFFSTTLFWTYRYRLIFVPLSQIFRMFLLIHIRHRCGPFIAVQIISRVFVLIVVQAVLKRQETSSSLYYDLVSHPRRQTLLCESFAPFRVPLAHCWRRPRHHNAVFWRILLDWRFISIKLTIYDSSFAVVCIFVIINWACVVHIYVRVQVFYDVVYAMLYSYISEFTALLEMLLVLFKSSVNDLYMFTVCHPISYLCSQSYDTKPGYCCSW